MKCQKCRIEIEQKDYTDTYRIEEHHFHPKFMDNPNGLGKKIILCRNCHILKLHPIIFEIIRRHSNLLSKRNKSWDWIWKYHVLGSNKQKCIEEVKSITMNWLNKKEGDDVSELSTT